MSAEHAPHPPRAWMLEWTLESTHSGTVHEQRLYDDERNCLLDAKRRGGACVPLYDRAAIDAAVTAKRELVVSACIDIVVRHGGSIEIEAAIRAFGKGQT